MSITVEELKRIVREKDISTIDQLFDELDQEKETDLSLRIKNKLGIGKSWALNLIEKDGTVYFKTKDEMFEANRLNLYGSWYVESDGVISTISTVEGDDFLEDLIYENLEGLIEDGNLRPLSNWEWEWVNDSLGIAWNKITSVCNGEKDDY